MDTTPNAAWIESHTDYLRRVARALLRSSDQAEDAVQETCLKATQAGPVAEGSRRAWLGSVLRNVVRQDWRTAARRSRREQRAMRRQAAPSAANEVARLEQVERLLVALRALTVEKRHVLEMRYFEGLPPRRIAERLEVPVDTVKSRLRLALGKLRLELGGADGAALHRARGLAVLLPTAFSSEPCSRLGTAGWGTLTMAGTKKLGLGIAVLLLTLAGGWAVLRTASLEDTPEIASTPKAEEELARAPTLRGTPGEARKVSGTTEGRPAPSSGGGASGVAGSPSEAGSRPGGADGDAPTTAPDVVAGAAFGADGEPLLGKAVLWRGGRFTTAGQIPVGKEAQSTLDMGRDGRFRFEEVENGSWYLGLDLGDGVSRLLYVAQSTGGDRRPEVTLRLGQGGIRGTVWGPDGLPVEGAIVRTGSQNPTLISQTTTDRDGRYAIGQLHGGIAYVSFALAGDLDDDATTFYRHLRIEDDGWTIVDHGSPRGLARVVGRVVCPDGEVVRAKGQIIFERMDRQGFLIMPYDAEGRFDQEVPEDTYRVHIWAPNGSATTSYRPEAPFTATAPSTETDFVLVGARVKGRVPADVAAGRTGIVHLVPTGEAASAAQRAGSLGGGARMVAWSEDGSFVLYGIPPGTYKLTAAATSGEERPALASVNIDVPEGAAELRQDIARP